MVQKCLEVPSSGAYGARVFPLHTNSKKRDPALSNNGEKLAAVATAPGTPGETKLDCKAVIHCCAAYAIEW